MRRFFTKRRIIIGSILIVIIAAIGFFVVRGRGTNGDVLTDTVKQQDLKRTVLATGQVTSSTDVSLNFKGSGVIAKVNAKVGDQVKANDILANLNQRDQAASVTQARGSLAQAQANYNKVVAGASGPDVDVAKAALAAAQAAYNATAFQQETLVNNARSAFYNSGLEAKRPVIAPADLTVAVSGSYTGTEQGSYRFQMIPDSLGFRLKYNGIESGEGPVIKRGIAIPLGTKGLFLTFSTTGNVTTDATWTIDIPNLQSSTYLSNLNAYNAAVQAHDQALVQAQNSINTAQTNLDLKQSAARPEDIAVAKAQLLSAQGQVEAANAVLESTVIRAPANGTITSVNVKVGEQASPSEPAIVLQDVDNLYVEANISEANIASVKLDQDVDFTFDALGSDKTFKGKVTAIDPASTVVSGVVNYKITASVEKFPDIKPGMTANMTVLVGEKSSVLAVPSRAVLEHDGKKFVRVIDNPKKKTYHEVEVTTGMDADGGLVEIASGLQKDQEIVTLINQKK